MQLWPLPFPTHTPSARATGEAIAHTHTTQHVNDPPQCIRYVNWLFNPLKGRGVNWLHFAIQV